jgi:hypothetical protein
VLLTPPTDTVTEALTLLAAEKLLDEIVIVHVPCGLVVVYVVHDGLLLEAPETLTDTVDTDTTGRPIASVKKYATVSTLSELAV